MVTQRLLVLSTIFFLLGGRSVTSQERFIPISRNPNIFVDTQDIFIQDHYDPNVRVARVVTIHNNQLSNVVVTFVNCQINTSGVFAIVNSQGQIIYMAQEAIEFSQQSSGTQSYEVIRTICSLPAQSGSFVSGETSNPPQSQLVSPDVNETDNGCQINWSREDNQRIVAVDDYLNVRQQPTTNSNIVARLPKDAVVTVIERTCNWAYVKHYSIEGWVYDDYLTTTDSRD